MRLDNLSYVGNYKKSSWECSIENINTSNGIISFVIRGSGSKYKIIYLENSEENYILIPDIDACCSLSYKNDEFWNKEKLSKIFGNVIDGITVARGIKELYKAGYI